MSKYTERSKGSGPLERSQREQIRWQAARDRNSYSSDTKGSDNSIPDFLTREFLQCRHGKQKWQGEDWLFYAFGLKTRIYSLSPCQLRPSYSHFSYLYPPPYNPVPIFYWKESFPSQNPQWISPFLFPPRFPLDSWISLKESSLSH